MEGSLPFISRLSRTGSRFGRPLASASLIRTTKRKDSPSPTSPSTPTGGFLRPGASTRALGTPSGTRWGRRSWISGSISGGDRKGTWLVAAALIVPAYGEDIVDQKLERQWLDNPLNRLVEPALLAFHRVREERADAVAPRRVLRER